MYSNAHMYIHNSLLNNSKTFYLMYCIDKWHGIFFFKNVKDKRF